jgi:drug/metabolite transporter (DMT)-like permease
MLSLLLFREPFHWTRALGIFLVMSGMFFITAKVN